MCVVSAVTKVQLPYPDPKHGTFRWRTRRSVTGDTWIVLQEKRPLRWKDTGISGLRTSVEKYGAEFVSKRLEEDIRAKFPEEPTEFSRLTGWDKDE